MNQKTLSRFFYGLFFCLLLVQASYVSADHSININAADQATLVTLTGIGEVKGQAIIDYRTTNGPFATIEAIMNVSGIGTATFNGIKDHITVTSPSAQTQTTSTVSTASAPAPPQTYSSAVGPTPVTVRVNAEDRIMVGGGSYFSATAYGTQALPLPGARFIWNFGDGTVDEGERVFHTYAYPGRYVVLVTAAYNFSTGMERLVVEAVHASVVLEAEGDGSLLIRNLSSEEIDVGRWSLAEATKTYVIPEHTIILAGEGVRLSPLITKLGGIPEALLLYPNGATAATAVVSKNSPLRGERVLKNNSPSLSSSVDLKNGSNQDMSATVGEGSVLGTSTITMDTQEWATSSPLVMSLVGLGLLLVGGVAGVRYLQSHEQKVTSYSADEFEIEE